MDESREGAGGIALDVQSKNVSFQVWTVTFRLEAAIGIEPMNKGFADLCLTTWLRRHGMSNAESGEMNKFTRKPKGFHSPSPRLISFIGAGDET